MIKSASLTSLNTTLTDPQEPKQSPSSSSRKPRILIAMITVGNGHKAPADAIHAALERLYPNSFDIDVLDFTAEVGSKTFDRNHKNSWDWMLENKWFPYWGQRFIDETVPGSITRGFLEQFMKDHAHAAAKYIKAKDYDLVVSTHFFTLQALGIAKERYDLSMPIVGINTDPFDGSILWAESRIDEMIVSSHLAKQKLMSLGIPERKLKIFGYPLGLKFVDLDLNQAQAREKLGLEPDKLTIMQSSGGEGLGGNLEQFVQAALSANLDIQYIVACGRNEELLRHLTDLAERNTGKTKLLPQGFITNMHEWLVATDLVLGKAGAATTFEALALNRPIFHTSYVAYNEKTNVDFCVNSGIGLYIPKPEMLVATLKLFLNDKAQLNKYAERLKELDLSPGTLDIARDLVESHLGHFDTTHEVLDTEQS